MAALTGNTIASTYKDLLQVSNSNSGVDGTLRSVEDGEGTASVLQISSSAVKVGGTVDLDGAVTINESSADVDFRVESNDNTHMLFVDAGNNRVGIGTDSPSLQFVVNAADGKSDNAYVAYIGNQEATDDRSYGLQIVAGSTVNDAPLFIQDHDASNDLLILRGNGAMGIGTTAPAARLHVHSDDETNLYITTDADNRDTGLWFGHDYDGTAAYSGIVYDREPSYQLKIFNNNSVADHLVISNDGHIGISTSSFESWHSNWDGILQISATTTLGNYNNTDTYLLENAYHDGSWKYQTASHASKLTNQGGTYQFSVAGSGSADATISWTDALTIANDGKIGVNEDNPAGLMHIAIDDGTMPGVVDSESALVLQNNSATGDGCTFTIISGTANNSQICFGDADDYDEGVILYNNNADDMTFRTAGSGEDMRLSSVGHLGIGCDPSDSYEIHVEASDTPMLALQDTTNNVVIGMSCDNSQTYVGSISNHTLVFRTNDANRGWFTDTGTFNVREVTGTASNNAGKMTTSNTSYATSLQLYGCARTSSDAWKVMTAYHGDGSNNEFNDVIFEVEGNGDVESDTGTYGTGASDYAEYFESKDEKAIAVGKTVKLDGGKVVACEDGDTPMGVVRPKQGACSVIGNKAQHSWHSKWLKNDYDEFIMEDCTVTEWTEKVYDPKRDSELGMYRDEFHSYETDKIPSDVTVPDDAKVLTEDSNGNKLQRKKINPDYKSDLKYEPREKRDSWCLIGLLGQIPITKGQPVSSNWIKMKDVSDTVEMYFVK